MQTNNQIIVPPNQPMIVPQNQPMMVPPNQPMMVPNQVVVVPNTSVVMPNGKKYNTKLVMSLGITQIILGTLILLIATINISSYNRYFVGITHLVSIFCGIWLIVTGSLGITSSRKPYNRCISGTNMGFNIAACVISLISVIMSFFRIFYYMAIIQIIVLLCGFGIALAASIYSCINQCGSNKTHGYITQPPQQFIQYGYPQTTANQGASFITNGAPVFMNQQPQVYYTQQPPPYSSDQINGQNMTMQAQSVAIPPVTQESK